MENRTSLTRSLAAPSVSCQVERADYSHITPRSNHSQSKLTLPGLPENAGCVPRLQPQRPLVPLLLGLVVLEELHTRTVPRLVDPLSSLLQSRQFKSPCLCRFPVDLTCAGCMSSSQAVRSLGPSNRMIISQVFFPLF